DKRDAAIKYARKKFEPFLLRSQVYGSTSGLFDQARYWNEIETPYITFYAFEEVPAVFKDEPGRPGTVLAANEGIARWTTEDVVRSLAPVDEERRKQVVDAYSFEAVRQTQIAPETRRKVDGSLPVPGQGLFGVEHAADESMRKHFLELAFNPP